MYSLRINSKIKTLVEEVAEMAGLTTSGILRKVRKKMDTGKLRLLDDTTVEVRQLNGDVIKVNVDTTYHKSLKIFISAEIEPVKTRETKIFRTCLVGACLDSKAKSAKLFKKRKELDEFYKNYNSVMVAERRALLDGVM